MPLEFQQSYLKCGYIEVPEQQANRLAEVMKNLPLFGSLLSGTDMTRSERNGEGRKWTCI
jgi:hypothetical protein